MRSSFALFLITGTQALAQNWTQLPDFPGTARDDAAAFTLDGAAYVGTGRAVDFSLTNDWYRFTDFGGWTQVASLPASGRQYCTAFTDGQYGYLFGGVDAAGPLNELWRYDPIADEWVQRASLPGPGRYASVVLHDRYIVTGMLEGGIATNECWEYDPAGDAWFQRSTMPGTPRHRAAANQGVVLGGADAAFEALNDCYTYHPASDTWSQTADLPEPRYGADACDGVFIGGAASDSDYSSSTWILEGSTWSTTLAPDFPGGVRRGGVITSAGMADLVSVHFGTGVDLLERHNDWWLFLYFDVGMREGSPQRIHIQPNPAIDLIRIEVPPTMSAPTVVVHDIVGREVHCTPLPASGWLTLDHLPASTYFMSIEQAGQPAHSGTLVIH